MAIAQARHQKHRNLQVNGLEEAKQKNAMKCITIHHELENSEQMKKV
jgi:hypothetical protein